MSKKFLIAVVFVLMILMITIILGCKAPSTDMNSDIETVEQYFRDNGFDPMPEDAIDALESNNVNGKSYWDLLVEYVKTGESPEGVEINIDEGGVEIRTSNPQY